MKKLIPAALSGLNSVLEGNRVPYQFHIDSKKLPSFGVYERATRKNGYLGELFEKLDRITSPVIYWFEAAHNTEAERQYKLIMSHGKKHKRIARKTRRVVPLPNGTAVKGTRTLYVGKRQGGCRKDGFSNIADRIETHLGYNPNGMNQGMQMAHWNDGIFTLNILEIGTGSEPYLTTLEQLFTLQLSPLLGRH